MIHHGPLNTSYVELTGTTARLNVPVLTGETQGRSVEFFLDFMLLGWASLNADTDITFAGAYPGFGWFEANMPDSSPTTRNYAEARFGLTRNSSPWYTDTGTIYLNQRHVLFGRDRGVVGEQINAWLDGVALGGDTTAYTAPNLQTPYDTKGSFDIGYDDFALEHTPLRVYEAWVKLNGVLILHFKPNENDTDNTTLKDLSPWGNDGVLAGTVETDYRYRSAWARDVALSGSMT